VGHGGGFPVDETSDTKRHVIESYRRRAPRYDLALRFMDGLAWLGFDISGWRRIAVSRLGLKTGDTVVDIGCGTGLNFALLHRAVGAQGKIIGVDLSEAMISQARRSTEEHQWQNVDLVCADASQFEFPARVQGVLSTYALTLVPTPDRVVSKAAQALVDGGRLVVLDMAWPRHCPLWFRNVLFFLRAYGVTEDVLRRRPWESVQSAMHSQLAEVSRRTFWFGFFYLSAGARREQQSGAA
jgi:ubiquinone/menaquinone biosynthesis C-methylase UbiE